MATDMKNIDFDIPRDGPQVLKLAFPEKWVFNLNFNQRAYWINWLGYEGFIEEEHELTKQCKKSMYRFTEPGAHSVMLRMSGNK